MNDEAKWLAENVVLPKLEALDKKLEKRDDTIWLAIEEGRKERTVLLIQCANIQSEIKAIKTEKKMSENVIIEHVQDTTRHYNPYFNETIRQKLWRKKPEIAAGGGTGVLIIGLLTLTFKALGWI